MYFPAGLQHSARRVPEDRELRAFWPTVQTQQLEYLEIFLSFDIRTGGDGGKKPAARMRPHTVVKASQQRQAKRESKFS